MDVNDRLEERLTQAGASVTPPPHDRDRFAARALDEGLADVAYAYADSPLGRLLVASTPRGLVTIAYLEFSPDEDVLDRIATRLSPRVIEAPARLDDARRQLDDYFEGNRREFELPIDWALVSDFTRQVLQRTVAIPFGEVATYGTVARDIGKPGAARATGNALGSNPMPIVVPCHRVVRGGGKLGGYTGGLERKKLLLSIERGGDL
jgi:methylated-DNA-[protein]-cysteine S-methyltransferase